MTIPQCPVCWSGETRIAYSAGHHQYQCDNCGYYGHAAGSDEEALEMVFKHIPGALGMLLDASASIELAIRNEKERPDRKGEGWLFMFEPTKRKIDAALKWFRDRHNEVVRRLINEVKK
jgi:hypothetical protein